MRPTKKHWRLRSLPIVLLVLLAGTVVAEAPPAPFLMVHSGPGLSLHKDMFMLPVTISDEYNGAQTEAVFQLSAKHRLFDTRFYFGYTQISFWQAYDHENSAPFRETNYNPEIFYRFKPTAMYSGYGGLDVGFEHESNGQRVPLSRSWNLIYASPYYYRSSLLVYLKLRYRIPEKEKESPGDAVGDDNPDITDYLGHTDFHIYYTFWKDHTAHLTVRGSFKTGKGGVTLTYGIPVPRSQRSSIAIRFSHGYGESMVDYNRSLTRIGFGIMFR
jgi:phospholipase A1